jgi:3-deoxy-D-manno-octulosonate 8-phosphate phosphatase (KDO 8-P phosphatase)
MNDKKYKIIKLMLFDVDGVLTDGNIIYNDNGKEIKVFNVKDGLGIRLLMKAGIQVGIITGRSSQALTHRCQNLGITLVYQGVRDKEALLNEIVEKTGFHFQEIAFMGDDLPDLHIMRKVGLSIAVADAHEYVIKEADMVTHANGGGGAVREVCEKILKSQGHWENLMEQIFNVFDNLRQMR